MKIELREEGELGSFVAVMNGAEVGELAFRVLDDHIMTLDHTEVEPTSEGKGIGRQLVQAAVDHARQQGMKVRPLCSYAQLLFERNTQWSEILMDPPMRPW
jgi:uncharacterized protein